MLSVDLNQVGGGVFAAAFVTWVFFAIGMIGLYRVGAAAHFWLDRQERKEEAEWTRLKSERATQRELEAAQRREETRSSKGDLEQASRVSWWKYEGTHRK